MFLKITKDNFVYESNRIRAFRDENLKKNDEKCNIYKNSSINRQRSSTLFVNDDLFSSYFLNTIDLELSK